MKRWIGVLALGLWLAIPAWAEAKLKVVATIPSLAAIAKEVGGSDVEVTCLSLPTQDPHFVDARPHLVLALNKADLLVSNGLELEAGWLPVLVNGSRNSKIQTGGRGFLDASTLVHLKQIPRGKVDRSMGDIHPGGNPHYLTDPRNGGKVAVGLAQRLGQLDPAHAADFKQRANTLLQKAQALADQEAARFGQLPAIERHVVTYHQSWIYVIDWLGLIEIGTIEPKPGIAPHPAHVANLLKRMQESHTDAIIQEAYYSPKVGKILAEKSRSQLVVLPGGPQFDKGETYLGYIQQLTNQLYGGLK